MIRIYLDTNVFSDLRNTCKYTETYNKILNMKEYCLFFYSDAHIEDLDRDSTDNKFQDLKFIETITDDNLLSYQWNQFSLNVTLATPTQYYESRNQPEIEGLNIDIEQLLALGSIIDFDDDPDLKPAKPLFELLRSVHSEINKIDKSKTFKFEVMPEKHTDLTKQLFNKIGDIKTEYTWEEWQVFFQDIIDKFHNDKELYKLSRRISKEQLEIDKHAINLEAPNFNELLKSTKLGKSFDELYTDYQKAFAPIPMLRDSFFIEYILKYLLVNALSLDKEKNKNIKFKNVLTDALHSFYSIGCNVVVSSDNGFLEKTKFLHTMYNVDTSVLSLEEFFSGSVPLNNNNFSFNEFADIFMFDLKNKITTEHISLDINHPNIYRIKTSIKYFNLFDTIDIINHSNKLIYIIYRQHRLLDRVLIKKDFCEVLNQFYKMLGPDDNNKSGFIDEDWEKMINNEWEGRCWNYNKFEIGLNHSKNTDNMFYLKINILERANSI